MINLNSDIKYIKGVGEKEPSFSISSAFLAFVRLFNFIPENIRIGPMKRWLGIVKTVKMSVSRPP